MDLHVGMKFVAKHPKWVGEYFTLIPARKDGFEYGYIGMMYTGVDENLGPEQDVVVEELHLTYVGEDGVDSHWLDSIIEGRNSWWVLEREPVSRDQINEMI